VEKSDTSESNKKTGREYTFWLWATIALTLLLVSSLPQLVLDDGAAYTDEWLRDTIVGEVNVLPLVMYAIVLISLFVLIYLRREHWRADWPIVLLGGLLLGSCMAFISLAPLLELEIPVEEEGLPEEAEEIEDPETAEFMLDSEVIMVDGFVSPPGWVTLLVSLLLAFTMLLVLYGLVYMLFLPPPAKEDETPFTEVVQQARTAIKALRQGEPLADVILRCYADMEQTLRTTQGIERHQTMTAREFEQQLVQLGLPAEAVRTLTRLFETVRYGRYTPNPDDETTALDSLTQIVAATGRERPAG
jgi:hypothetical protein